MMPAAIEPTMPSASTNCFFGERRGHPGRRADRAEHGGGVKAGLVDELGCDQARAAGQLDTDRNALQGRQAREALALGDCENRGDDDGAGMDRAAFERVVEVFAMRGGAVHKRRAGGIQRARLADGGAVAGRLPAVESGAHVIGIARGDAQAGDIDEELLDDLARRLAGARDGVRQLF